MDYTLTRGDCAWRLRPLTARARTWLERNYSSTDDLVIPSAHGPMLLRALHLDCLAVVSRDAEDAPYDFYDQQSLLLRCASERRAGRCQDALLGLVTLRACVLAADDARSSALLPQIDREIGAAYGACRTDAPGAGR